MWRLALALVLSSCAAAREPPKRGAPPGRVVTVSIVATNDVHGQLERLPILAGYVANLRRDRRQAGGVLLVDAGDAFQGTIESNLNEGAAVIAAFNAMGYDAFALGNHEFDFGPTGPVTISRGPDGDPQGALQARLTEARFPVLSANLIDGAGATPPWKNLRRSALVEVAGVRVGLVGLITAEAAEVIKRPNFAGLRSAPLPEATIREATALRRRGADLVVVVAHAGGRCARVDDPRDTSSCDPEGEIFRLARVLPAGLADAIVGGHVNAAVAHFVEGIPVVHAPSNLVAFSRIDVTFDLGARRVLGRGIEPPHPLCTAPMEAGCAPGAYAGRDVVADRATIAAVAPAISAAGALRRRPLGVRVEAPFPVGKRAESALGNLFTDILRETPPGADAALGNAGSIRDTLPAGDLTFGQLHHVMPFDNQVSHLRLRASELAALLTKSLVDDHGLPSISGFRVIARCAGGSPEVTLTDPSGAPLPAERELVVATNDFLALGGDDLLGAVNLPPGRITVDTGVTVQEALIQGLSRRRSIRPDDPALSDPARPRWTLPGPIPLKCGGAP